ncbi:MAG: threonine ammonia-lyase IlvA [Bacteroidota bacterium]
MISESVGMLPLARIMEANQRLKGVVEPTPLQKNLNLSDIYDCEVLLKREDLQVVRSYKIRGAYNRMAQLDQADRTKGIVCASAGNHAQGVALSCYKLGIEGKIYMPSTTPRQKVRKVKLFGKDKVEVLLVGDTFDDAYAAAIQDSQESGAVFVHPFNDPLVMAGQGTVGMEILDQVHQGIDYVFLGIGGGGLASGLGSYIKQLSPSTKIIGVEPSGAPAMKRSLEKGEIITLDEIDKFVDGAAVKRVGEETFQICREVLDDTVVVPEGKICTTILHLYDEEAIVVEPAGALAIAALDQFKEEIKGKRVVCVVSGGNNDITRMEEIKERSLLYEGLKYYFLIRFPQRAGALIEFLSKVLGPTDDITHFEYSKKNNRNSGPALVGIELENAEDYTRLIAKMEAHKVNFQLVNDNHMLFNYLI